ncbi:3637_t:CDS:2 [Entrophospora sp. SA101]|nr:3637_t:CDS:2 [Entrophospora sp. SA101]
MDRSNTINETSEERRRRLNRERQQRYRKNKRNTGLDHSGEKRIRIQDEVSNAIDETSEERQRRLNRERQQHNVTIRAEQEVVIHLTTVPLKTLKARIYPWSSQGLDRHSLGSMNHRCNCCGALLWIDERTGTSTRSPVFTTCCAKGKVFLPPIEELPYPLNILLTRTDPSARSFRKNIRSYNSALAFTSMGAKVDHSITGTSGIYSFRVHVILEELQQMLHDVNPYCEMFKQAGDIVRLNPSLDLRMAIIDSRKQDSRRYNTPTTSEVAVIMIGDGQEAEPLERNICLP